MTITCYKKRKLEGRRIEGERSIPSPVKRSMTSIIRSPTLLLTALLSMLQCVRSQGPAPALVPVLDCTDDLLNLSSCLTYVEEGSNLTRPEKGCCRSLAGLLGTEPVCLCQLTGNYDSFGVRIDTTKALMLTTVCRLNAPPASLCAVLGAPITGPSPTSGDPVGSSPATPAIPPKSNSGRSILRITVSAFLSALCCTAMAIATF